MVSLLASLPQASGLKTQTLVRHTDQTYNSVFLLPLCKRQSLIRMRVRTLTSRSTSSPLLSQPPIYYPVKLNYRLDKRGSNKYIVLSYEPILVKKHELDADGVETLQNFRDLIKDDDERVADKMRANMVTQMEDDFSDVTDSGE